MLQFTVEIKYLKGAPLVLAKFKDEADARAFIQSKVETDRAMRANTTYILLELGEAVETFDSASAAGVSTASSGSGQGNASGSYNRPNPLQTTLRPSGMPQTAPKETDDKDKQ